MGNKVIATALPEVKLIEPDVFCDEFGFCFESFSADEFTDDVSQGFNFVQDRHLRAVRGVLRGLHYQVQRPQGRLVRVVRGEVFDVVVDVRLNSPNFGKWTGTYLSEIESAATLGAARFRTGIRRFIGRSGMFVENHRVLVSGTRALHLVERSRHRHRVADRIRADSRHEGCCGAASLRSGKHCLKRIPVLAATIAIRFGKYCKSAP